VSFEKSSSFQHIRFALEPALIAANPATDHVLAIKDPLASGGKLLSMGMASATTEWLVIHIKCKLPFVCSIERIEALVG
jgi:hypothetical protein